MNPIILSAASSRRKTEFFPVKHCLKIDLMSHLARAEGVCKYI